MTAFGERCSDISLDSIMDEDECIFAVKVLGRIYKKSETTAYYPAGCYCMGRSEAYFNNDFSGIRNAMAKAVCMQGILYHFSRDRNKVENHLKYYGCESINQTSPYFP